MFLKWYKLVVINCRKIENMNKTRIFGGILIIAGGISIFTFDNDGIGFISGILFGLGIGFVLKSFSTKNKSFINRQIPDWFLHWKNGQ